MSQLTPSSNIVGLYIAINNETPGYTQYTSEMTDSKYSNGISYAQQLLSQNGVNYSAAAPGTVASTVLSSVFSNLGLATTGTTGAAAAQAGLYNAMVAILNSPTSAVVQAYGNNSLAYAINWLVSAVSTLSSSDPNYSNYSTAQTNLNNAIANGITYSSVSTNVSAGTPSTTTASTSYTLTTGVDNITATANNNTINGTQTTVTGLDSINLGTSTGNTLNLVDTGTAASLNLGNFTSVSGVQTLNLQSVTGLNAGAADVSGFTGLTAANFTLLNPGANQTITAAATTNVSLTDKAVGANTDTVLGGNAVTVVASGESATATSASTTSAVIVGNATTGAAGAVNVTVADVYKPASTLSSATTNYANNVTVNGGTTVSVTENISTTDATGYATSTGGKVTVNGTSSTTSVSVAQTAAATASTTAGAIVEGIADGAVAIADANGTSQTKAGTITSVSLSNYGAATITDNALTTLTLAGNGAGVTVTDNLTTPTVTTLLVNANALTDATGITDAKSEIATLNVVTGGSSGSTIGAVTDTGLKTLNVSGTQQLTLTTTPGSLKTVTVSGGAGAVVSLGSSTSFSSTSTGTDVVTIAAAATQTVTGNGTANEEIVWNGTTAPASTAYLGTVTGFKVLGIGSSVVAGENFDMSKMTGFTGYDVQANTQTGTVQLQNVTAGSPLTIDGAFAGTLVYQTADTAGPTDSVAVTLGGASTTAGFTVAGLTLEDSVLNGIGKVTVTTDASTAAAVNTITTLHDASLTSLTVAGTGGLAVTNAFTTNAATLTINGTSSGTGGITFGGISDTSLTTLTLSGTDNINLGTVTDGTGGITVSGSSYNANATLTLGGATASGMTDSVTLGNGNDTITDTAALAGATVKITLGNGNDTVNVGANATNTVVLGTGTDSVTESGPGANLNVTFGTHATTAVDSVSVYGASGATIAPAAVITGLNVTGADTIHFLSDTSATGAITAYTIAQINTYGNNPTTLAGAVAGVLAASGGNLAQHAIGEFNFQNNTYFVEQAGTTGSAFAASDTVVELVGTLTFTTATTATSGVLTLHG